MSHIISGLILLAFLLFLFLFTGIMGRSKNAKSISMSKTNKVTRVVEAIIIFSAGLVFLINLGCFNDGMLLHLNKLRPAFATTHIIITVIALAFLFLSVLLTWFGKTFMAVIIMTIVLISYSVIIKKAPFEGPGYIMTKIAPKDSWVPIVNYTFKVNYGLEGAEVWINGVYLGKTPFEITADEFNSKVPILTEPPEGYPDENKIRPEGGWFEVQIAGLKKRDNASGQGISYLSDFNDCYAKIKYADELGKDCVGTSGGGSGDLYQYDYEVSLSGHFSVTDKIEHDKNERFNKLIQKARLANYHVESDWFEAIETYGEKAWKDIQNLSKDENDFSRILTEWTKWKYDISDDMTQKKAWDIFERIYDNIDTAANPYLPGQAINIIYDKLNLNDLVKKYEKIIDRGNDKTTNFQKGIIRQALKRWDTKLNNENPGAPNIIEKRIVPALIVNNAVDYAITFGGPDIDRYLIRKYQKDTRIQGVDLGSENTMYTMGMHINKWLLNLAYEDLPQAIIFRKNNKNKIMELAKLMTNNNFNNSKLPPEFLFKDIELGEKSMAYEFWPEYSAMVESSFPPWWYEILQKRWKYLSKLDSLATEQMYIDCWRKTKKLENIFTEQSLARTIEAIPVDKRISVAKYIIEDIQKYVDAKRADLDPEQVQYHSFPQSKYIDAIKKHLAEIGDEESIQWQLSELIKSGPNNNEPQRFREMLEYENVPANHPMIKALAQNENPDLRILSLDAIHKFPISANRVILEKLLSDSDEQVRSAAQQVAAELEQLRDTSVDELISNPKGS